MPLILKSDHVRNGDVVLGEQTIHFNSDGLSGDVSQEVARHAVLVPGFTLHEGQIRPERQPHDNLTITIEVQDATGKVVGAFTKKGTMAELFADNVAALTVKLKEKAGASGSNSTQ